MEKKKKEESIWLLSLWLVYHIAYWITQCITYTFGAIPWPILFLVIGFNRRHFRAEGLQLNGWLLEKVTTDLYRNILVLKERFPWYGTSFKGHKNLQQDSSIERDYQRKQNHTSNHSSLYLRLYDRPYLLWHWPFCSSLVFMGIFTSTLSASFGDSEMKTVELP